jgi:meso-butanediol dehydrogenase/(S,S)-butanediol dehydrogenase/diacetyl reductase
MEFEGKIVVVTGGNSGMGKEAVKLFVEQGAIVIFTGSKADERSEALLAELAAGPGKAVFKPFDVADESACQALAQYVEKEYGRIDVLCNNAGTFAGGMIHETDTETWDRLFAVNTSGVYYMCKHFIPMMRRQQKGAVVNTASVSGLLGEYNMAAYSATKGAVVNLTRSMALDYADEGIRINSVCPGATYTPMFMTGSTPEIIQSFEACFPPKRAGKPEEVAQAILFLASSKASFINGQNLPVEGGLSAHTGQPRQDKEAVLAEES